MSNFLTADDKGIKFNIETDAAEAFEFIKDIARTSKSWATRIQKKVNREVIKKAKANYRALGTDRNNPAVWKGDAVPQILKNFHTGVLNGYNTYISNRSYHSVFIERGAHIVPRHKKGRLYFTIDGELKSAESVDIQARPFFQPAFAEFWNSAKARQIMEKELERILEQKAKRASKK